MKFKHHEMLGSMGILFRHTFVKFEAGDAPECFHCKKSLMKEKVIYMCEDKKKSFTCEDCEKSTIIKRTYTGDEYKHPKYECPFHHVPKSVVEQISAKKKEHSHWRVEVRDE